MAELVSPGVSISVTDESFYASAGAGTVPLIIIATAQDKASPDGVGTAAFTTSAEAGKVKLITSQRELLQNFGNPLFYSSGSTQLNGYDLNEYGLLAAHSFLGLSNRAWVLRADVDLGELEASAISPAGATADGAHWVDIDASEYGVREYQSGAWVKKEAKICEKNDVRVTGEPKQSFGLNGDYAIVAVTSAGEASEQVKYFEKFSDDWYEIGSTSWSAATSGDFQFATHLRVPSLQSDGVSSLVDGDVFVQTTTPNSGMDLRVKAYSGSTKAYANVACPVYASGDAAYDDIGITNVAADDVIAIHGESTATIEFRKHDGSTSLVAVGGAHGTVDVTAKTLSVVYKGVTTPVAFTASVSGSAAASTVEDSIFDINSALSGAGVTEVVASEGDSDNIVLTSSTGYDIKVISVDPAFGPSSIGLGSGGASDDVLFTNWADLSYKASKTKPTGTLADGTYWYDASVSLANVDLLENHVTNGWQSVSADLNVTATRPTKQSDGSTPLAGGELWLDSDDLENFPKIYRYSAGASAWVAVDGTDQVTADGIIYEDFRAVKGGSLSADAPAKEKYPVGILGWNKRASGGNVKEWKVDYVANGVAVGNVWVDASGNQVDGKMHGMRKAVHNLVKTKMQEVITSNDAIRSEINAFNLITAPGYPELLDEMVALSGDRRNTAFVIADSPMRLDASATSVQAWATNANNASENGEDGLLSSSPYAAVYYPSAMTTNLDGTNVVVPPSHVALRTFAFNDQVAFPWFAPAGFQRGLVQNATSVGYVDADSGEYVPVTLNEGQRDTLYLNKVNPIAQFPGRGLAVFGQKTLNPTASALDRVNVARLIVYLRERLDDIVKPFLFEPNDALTRAKAKNVVDKLLSNLVIQRGLFDFVSVCDETNNTPARIDRNELYIDIAIQPVKAIEFIYIPIRVQNTLGSSGS